MFSRNQSPGLSWLAILLVALSLSIGWGVRGNWGHEYGAMIPGALAAMAAVLVSGRDDWYRRAGFFAFYGAVGWSFGGSISYMQVIAYTHSGDATSVIYGFACLFLIGFIWAAFGGAGTALPAFLDRQRLTELLIPAFAVFVAWAAQDQFFDIYLGGLRDQVAARHAQRSRLRQQDCLDRLARHRLDRRAGGGRGGAGAGRGPQSRLLGHVAGVAHVRRLVAGLYAAGRRPGAAHDPAARRQLGRRWA